MKAEEQKILNDSLSKLFKMDTETLASLYNEAGDLVDFSKVLEMDKERIQKYKSESSDQFKRGIKEGAEKIEKSLKEKYELESDLVGIDLVDHLVVTKAEEAKTSTKDITKHPEYIKLQVSIDKQLKVRDQEWQGKLEAQEKEIATAKLFEKVSKRALANLKSRNPILSPDPRKAQMWENVYLEELKKFNFMEDENGDPIVLGADGNKLQSPHGKNISFDEFEKDVAEKYFDYPKSTDRTSAGLKEEAGSGNGFTAPKDEDEYMKRLRDPQITVPERIKLTEYWMSKT